MRPGGRTLVLADDDLAPDAREQLQAEFGGGPLEVVLFTRDGLAPFKVEPGSFPDDWGNLHREIVTGITSAFAEADDGVAPGQDPPLDTWSHFLVSEIEYLYFLWCVIDSVTRRVGTARVVLYLPGLVQRGVTPAEGLDILRRVTTIEIHDRSRPLER